MKALKIISIIIVLILVIIAAFVGYSCYAEYSHQKDIDKFISDASKNTRMALVDAYNQQDWEKVVGYGMALEEHGDTIGNLTIAYAEGLCACGYYEKARKILLDRIKSHPEDQLDYLYKTLGVLCYCEGKFDDAITYYKKSVEINPFYARSFINMAGVYYELHKYEESTDNYLKAIELFYAHSAYEETETFSKQILEMNDKNIEAYIYLAATCYKQNRNEEYEDYKDLARKYGGIYATDKINELIK